MNKVLNVDLNENEFVHYLYEEDMKKTQGTAKMWGYIFVFIGIVGAAFIFPIIFLFLGIFAIVKSGNPDKDRPVGLVLTNQRFIQIHYDENVHPNIEIRTSDIADVDCERSNTRGGTSLVAVLAIKAASAALDSYQDSKGISKPSYWGNVESILFELKNETVHKLTIPKEHQYLIPPKLGIALANGLIKGWDNLEKTNEDIPAERRASRL